MQGTFSASMNEKMKKKNSILQLSWRIFVWETHDNTTVGS
jgi:hypothetical protein